MESGSSRLVQLTPAHRGTHRRPNAGAGPHAYEAVSAQRHSRDCIRNGR